MNTDHLAKHYARLTAAERLPLLMAASALRTDRNAAAAVARRAGPQR